MKTRVAVIFGGRSLEHDVSVITGMQVLGNIDKSKYIVEPIYMRDGDFYVQDVDKLDEFVQFDASRHKKALLVKGEFFLLKRQGIKKYFKPDVVLVACHGGEGENGNLQSLLEMNGLAYTSPDVFASSLCIDKEFSKRMFESMLLPVVPYEAVGRKEFLHDKQQVVFSLESFLTYPMIVKPARLGSSIGISVANDRAELESAVSFAFEFDDKVVIEQKLENFAEVNCAAYFDGERVVVSKTEQPIHASDFLTFADKYEQGGKMSETTRIIPADIGSLNLVVQAMTERIYRDLDMNGIVRIDYLVDVAKNKVYINEINTVPGSLAFYLFDLGFDKLLASVIESAKKRKEERRQDAHFKTDILSKFKGGVKMRK